MRAPLPAHLILVNLITLIILTDSTNYEVLHYVIVSSILLCPLS
jgi:hypothetical protein